MELTITGGTKDGTRRYRDAVTQGETVPSCTDTVIDHDQSTRAYLVLPKYEALV